MKLSWRRQRLTAKHAFGTSRGAIREKETLLLTLEHEGLAGVGEAAPSVLYGQTLESTEAVFASCGDALGDDPFAIEPIVARLICRFDGQRAAISAIDAALHDWVGKRLSVPVWRLLGLSAARCQTTFTIGTGSPDETRTKLDEALRAGFDALKVKIGTPQDEQTLEIIRARFSGRLVLDANEAWSPDEAESRLRGLARFDPALIEQPLPRDHWRELARLKRLGVAPIYVDESCERAADVLRLAEFVDGVNIKFSKCGGIREALRMIALARGLNLGVMLGCFLSSSLAIAPALSIASLADHADLDGHLLLADDPFAGIERDGGELLLAERPGLGVVPRG
ncbi:MAG: L-Ala-D/L-Glu epimerase [Phycisphaerae bacterium]|nr:L-Ala-D/L-Glu epimerase [Phycisphaerae bacterium]